MSELSQNSRTGLEIAVIGMAGRFPGAKNIEEFWANLKNGIESTSFFSDEELEKSGIDPGLVKKSNYVKAKGVLEGIEYFDASFFEYSTWEAEVMDPQFRVLHECCWEALEDAGYAGGEFAGAVGLYVGSIYNSYWLQRLSIGSNVHSLQISLGSFNDRDFLSTRLAYKLDLKGPAVTVQTACSTSLVSIHLGCQALLSGECDIVLAGGVSILLPGKNGYLYEDGMIRSADGLCRAFDAKANGTNGGDGAAVVVLKRLENALADKDYIDAVIRGSAINNDGKRKVGYTAPSVEGQLEVIRAALQMAEVEPESITFVEAHGTATALGDPVEIEALKRAFATNQRQFCAIGSVKTNVGHLDAAAGAAGFIKAVLALKHRLIPPSLHFETPNPRIDFENSPFYVNAEPKKWIANGRPMRAGVSSFGLGGTNAHVILEGAPGAQGAAYKAQGEKRESPEGTRGLAPTPDAQFSREYQLIVLSAKTSSALDKMTENLAEYLKENLLNPGNPGNPGSTLADVSYTLQIGRCTFQHRRMSVCTSLQEAIDILSGQGPGKIKTFFTEKGKNPVIFMFPGQGSQYVNMGWELYQTEPVFREEIDRCFELLKPLMDYDLKKILYPGDLKCRGGYPYPPTPGNSPLERGAPEGRGVSKPAASSNHIDQTEIAQPVIFAFEYALAKLLMAWGIQPYAMLGHSIGEYTAACLSGVFCPEEALELVVLRGKLMQKMPPGSMLSINIPEDELRQVLAANEEISLAAVNGPQIYVVSGPQQAVARFEKELKQKGHTGRRLHTSHAFHSRMMDPILAEFEQDIGRIRLKEPEMPYISNISGTWITMEEAVDPGYWARQLRQTVRFGQGLEEVFKTENAVLVEVGPGRSLSALANKHPGKDPDHRVMNLLRHPQENIPDARYLMDRIGRLWSSGVSIDWKGFHQDRERRRLPLPTYPFEGKRYWKYGEPVRLTGTAVDKGVSPGVLPDKNEKKAVAQWFYIPSWKLSLPPRPDSSPEPPQHPLLVFIHDFDPVNRLLNALAHKHPYIIKVKAGNAFNRIHEHEYTLAPEEPRDYDRLIAQLEADKQTPFKIIHLWGVTGDNRDGKKLKEFYSLLYITQALGKHHFTQSFQIAVVTDNMQEITGQEPLNPWKAAVLGPIKVVPQEYPNIDCRSIDIRLAEPGSPEEEKLLSLLTTELIAHPGEEYMEPVIAYRGPHRWVRCFEPVPPGAPGEERLRDRGVYLISGGLGNIGMILAKYLAQTVKARIILTSRRPLLPGEEWERKKQEIEALGGKVLVLNADAANREQMQRAINRGEEHFGPLNGVIHAAGITAGPSIKGIREIDKTGCREQFRAKIEGLEILHSLLQGKDLDFCFLMSSLAAVLGGLGFTAYSAANLFMDAFAQQANRQNRIPWISVNWDAWQSETIPLPGEGITHQEGVEAFRRILSHPFASRVVVSTRDLSTRINQWINRKYSRPPDIRQVSEVFDKSIISFNQTERTIALICRNFLGIESIDVHDNFFEMGASSLDIIRFNSQLKEILEKDIAVERWFEYPTIASLAKYLDGSDSTTAPQTGMAAAGSVNRAAATFKITRRKQK